VRLGCEVVIVLRTVGSELKRDVRIKALLSAGDGRLDIKVTPASADANVGKCSQAPLATSAGASGCLNRGQTLTP
jgi:hypothetical protein